MAVIYIPFQEAPTLTGSLCWAMDPGRLHVCSAYIMVWSTTRVFWKNCLHVPAKCACFIVFQTPDVSPQASWIPVCVASILRSTWRRPPSLLHLGPRTPTCLPTKGRFFNSSPPSAAYMRQWIESALVQIMVCRLFGVKPLSESMLGYYQLDPWEQTSV